eukprot:bmy_05962T0
MCSICLGVLALLNQLTKVLRAALRHIHQRVFSDMRETKSCSFLTTRWQCHLMHIPVLTPFVFQI